MGANVNAVRGSGAGAKMDEGSVAVHWLTKDDSAPQPVQTWHAGNNSKYTGWQQHRIHHVGFSFARVRPT